LALLASPTLHGQTSLEEYVVTATRQPAVSGESAFSNEVITADEFREESFRTIPEAFALTPGVSVQKTTHGHGSPFIRGFTGRQNLYLIDGVRLNNSTFRGGPIQYANTVDGFALERLELIKSQGSVLYGSDALGGTVNAITTGSGYREEDGGFFQNGSALYRFDTNSQSHVGHFRQTIGEGGKWGLTLAGSWKDFGDVRSDFYGEMEGTGYPEQGGLLKFEWSPGERFHITLAQQVFNQDEVSRWHSTIRNPGGWAGTTPGTSYIQRFYDQERYLSYLKLAGEPRALLADRFTTTLSYQTSQDSEFQERTDGRIRTQGIDTNTYGLDVQLEKDLPSGTFLYGGDFYEDRIDSQSRGRSLPLADDSRYHSLGVFGQYRHDFGDRLSVDAGLRYTYAKAELGSLDAEDDWDALVFASNATYDLSDDWSLFGGIRQGFRAPNVNDLSGNLTARSGITALGSTDLEPEKTITYELGTRVQSDRFTFSGAAFYTDLDELITSVPQDATTDDTINTNASEGYITGVEIEGGYELNDCWALTGFASYQYGNTDTPLFLGGPDDEQPVSRLAPLRGSLALRYQDPGSDWWAEARAIAAGKADRLTEGDKGDTQRIPPGGTPGYFVANVSAGWQATDNLSFVLALENLTDTDYRIHGSGLNEPGFNAILSTRLTW
jgi:hemoglobin/transferrin/lactoferrin receptor protein